MGRPIAAPARTIAATPRPTAATQQLPALPPAFVRSYRLMQVRAAAATVALIVVLVIVVGTLASLVLPQLPAALLAAEAVFHIIYRRRKARLDAVPACHEPQNHDGWVPFRAFMASSRHVARHTSIGELLKCWFGNVKESDIKRDNVADLLCYGFWYRTRETMESLGLGHVAEQMVDMVEEAWDFKFEEGFNPDLKYMTHIWEPLKCHWRPLCFYALMEVGALIKHVQMLACGFSCHSHVGFTYYTYGMDAPGAATRLQQAANPRMPFLFTHGVGAGLLPYVPFVQRLACTGHPVIAVEFRHLAMRWTNHLPTVDDVAQAIAAILKHQGLASVGVVAHSYGTFYASRLLQLHPDMVYSLCIVDPVTICMWSGHLMANFVYHPSRSSSGPSIWLIARDIHSAASVSRHFYWTSYNLWPHMLPERTLVVLSGRDDLVPIRHVERMLQKETRAHLVLHPHHAHADFTFDQKWQEEVLLMMMRKLYNGLEGAANDGNGSSAGSSSCASSVIEGSGSDSEAAPLVRVVPLKLETPFKVKAREGPAAAAGRRIKAA